MCNLESAFQEVTVPLIKSASYLFSPTLWARMDSASLRLSKPRHSRLLSYFSENLPAFNGIHTHVRWPCALAPAFICLMKGSMCFQPSKSPPGASAKKSILSRVGESFQVQRTEPEPCKRPSTHTPSVAWLVGCNEYRSFGHSLCFVHSSMYLAALNRPPPLVSSDVDVALLWGEGSWSERQSSLEVVEQIEIADTRSAAARLCQRHPAEDVW